MSQPPSSSRSLASTAKGSRKKDEPEELYSSKQKLALFKRLFRGRADVYPTRWENERRRISGYSPECGRKFVKPYCDIRNTKCSKCPNAAFLPVDNLAIEKHLRGHHTMGIYPLLQDNTCWFLALDFDKSTWREDIKAVRQACILLGVSAYIECSRSGNGGHLWLFFSEAVSAMSARLLGGLALSEAKLLRPSLTLSSYDRMFPNQDTMPAGGFGNLIALPLQRAARQEGGSVFLDEELVPYPGEAQWVLLAGVERISAAHLAKCITKPGSKGLASSSTQALELFNLEPKGTLNNQSTKKDVTSSISGPVPKIVRVKQAQRLCIEREALSKSLEREIRKLASFSNPEFYKKKRARKSTWKTPPNIDCSESEGDYLTLPRGCLTALSHLCDEHGITVEVLDGRHEGSEFPMEFKGSLTSLQHEALEAAMPHDIGIIVLPPGTGKTVLGAALIAKRSTSTLILVNRRPLLEQWRAQLASFLFLQENEIGQIGTGKMKPNGRLDVAMIQSLAQNDPQKQPSLEYGLVIVDECHHAAAPGFETLLSRIPARYFLGLTATPIRRNGHHPIMHMQLGPVRFKASAKRLAKQHSFDHRFFVRNTEFISEEENPRFSDLQSELSIDEQRNSFILDDVVAALREGRSPLVLCARREHVLFFSERLRRYSPNTITLLGGPKNGSQKGNQHHLQSLGPDEQRLIVATGSYIGEGFDDARLDTLFLTSPISWKGILTQYSGRLHRQHSAKREVWIFDYLDDSVPMLVRMFEKRRRGYKTLGYTECDPPDDFELMTDPRYCEEDIWEDDYIIGEDVG